MSEGAPVGRIVARPSGSITSATAIVVQFAVQLVVGVLLARTYAPTPGSAWLSVGAMPPFFRAVHYWGSALLILHCAGYVAYLLWTGRANGEGRTHFVSSVGLFLCAFGFQVTGNLLPWDKHGVQSAAIEGTIAARIPVVGASMREAMLNGDMPSGGTIMLWWAIHRFLLPALLLVIVSLLISDARARKEPRPSPWGAIGVLSALAMLAAAIPAPLASRAGPEDPMRYDALSSWYTWAAHGSLVMWDRFGGLGWFGASGMLVLLLIGTLAAAILPAKYGRGWLLVAGGYLAVCALGFGGKFAPLTGRRDPPTAPKVADPATTQAIAPKDSILAARGAKVFEAEGCGGCHGKNGNQAIAGPSLKDVGKRHPDREWFVRYVKNPQSVKPGSVMPAYPNLPKADLEALGEYLRFPR